MKRLPGGGTVGKCQSCFWLPGLMELGWAPLKGLQVLPRLSGVLPRACGSGGSGGGLELHHVSKRFSNKILEERPHWPLLPAGCPHAGWFTEQGGLGNCSAGQQTDSGGGQRGATS